MTPNRKLVLVAMIFAVAMMFIDQTIVALAVPGLSRDLSLSSTGTQWIVNGYLLSLSALFAFGGRLADVLGHRRMVMVGVTGFAVFSALCGATPTGALAEPWIIGARVMQGASAALLFPAALAIVVASFPYAERGRALAVFFGVTGALTSIGPLLGGYLTQWTWRSIFWINIPVAIVALVLTAKARPEQQRRDAPIDYRGALLISSGVGFVVLGLQQASAWGWTDVRTLGSIVVGLGIAATFVAQQLREADPLIDLRVFGRRAFAFDNAVLLLISTVFVPFFFFASVYAQASLGDDATSAGVLLLAFFAGYALAAQGGGRIVDARGARPAVLLGCAVAAAGLFLWGAQLPALDFGGQWYFLTMAGAGLGLVLGPISTDALSRAGSTSFGEITGITQTVRNLGASLGLAVMGSLFIARNATGIGHAGDPASHAARLAVAHSTQTVAWVMAAVMALALVVAWFGLAHGRAPASAAPPATEPAAAAPAPAPAPAAV
jgi:EmrB/QacA subfamily drug resistance transporter